MRAKQVMLLMATALLAFGAAVYAAEVPGVTAEEVVIGVTTPQSGPAALWGVTAQGIKAWADHVNAQGGIHGRKIKMLIMNDEYNATRGLANLQEMKGKVFATSSVLGTAICNAAKDFFAENKIPLVCPYADVRIWANLPKEKRHYVFVAYPDYEDEAQYLTNYSVEKLKAKSIALFYQNDDYGKMAMQGVEKALAALGGKAKLVATVPYEVTETSLGSHALKLMESKADAVIMYPTPKHGALISKEMAKLEFKPNRLTTFTLGDPIMYALAGEAWEGTYIALPGNSGLPTGDPEADKVVEVLLKYDPKIKGKEYLALFGAASFMHLVEGLKKAGKDLTVDSFIKGMEQIKDWKPEGVGAPVTYGPDRHHGVNASRMGVAKGGKHVPLEQFTIYKPRL